jgi:hypothetical protein
VAQSEWEFLLLGLMGTASTLEVTYFGVQESNTASSAGATSVFSVPTINFGARTVVADYRSRLGSTEINIRDDLTDWLTLLAGFRWVEGRRHARHHSQPIYHGFTVAAQLVW